MRLSDHVQERVDPERKDTARVRAKLKAHNIGQYIRENALCDLGRTAVTPRGLALPSTAQDPHIVAQFEPEGDPETTVAGAVESGARVRSVWDVLVVISYTDSSHAVAPTDDEEDPDDADDTVEVRKKVTVVIDVLTDRNAIPHSAEIVRVRATKDDPGRAAWTATSLASQAAIRTLLLPNRTVQQMIDRQAATIWSSLMPKFDVSSLMPKFNALDVWKTAGYDRIFTNLATSHVWSDEMRRSMFGFDLDHGGPADDDEEEEPSEEDPGEDGDS